MAWNTPRAWAAGELVTAGNMNLYISDLLSYLKGSAGAVTIDNALTVSGTLTTSGAVTIGGQTAYHTGNLPTATAATPSTLAMRDGSGHITANHFNAVASDQTTTIPTKIAGQGGDNYYRWYNETNWQRASTVHRLTGSLDLGQASAVGNIYRYHECHAWGGALTVSCTGSTGLLVGGSIVASTVIASGDSYSFYAMADNYWELV